MDYDFIGYDQYNIDPFLGLDYNDMSLLQKMNDYTCGPAQKRDSYSYAYPYKPYKPIQSRQIQSRPVQPVQPVQNMQPQVPPNEYDDLRMIIQELQKKNDITIFFMVILFVFIILQHIPLSISFMSKKKDSIPLQPEPVQPEPVQPIQPEPVQPQAPQ